ncbi:MAG: arginine--tRNA ligase [Candidatus Pacebacteria bacterium]|nr:arginine--tRNA ligase [Candidatus Paceibacterota bacterium]
MFNSPRSSIKKALLEITESDFDVLVPPDSKLGDYSTNVAFILAKKEGKKPADVANELREKLAGGVLGSMFDMQVAPNGFLNFYAKSEFLQNQLGEISKNETYGRTTDGKGKKIIVEYSSPNIAKPMHVGHLRSNIIGDSLGNIYEKLGFDVVRWNYLGDWGTQFGKVIAGYKKWGEGKEDFTMGDLLQWYVKAGAELPEEVGAEEFKKLENGDSENRKLWERVREISIAELKTIYQSLGTRSFDVYKGESDYEPKLKPLIEDLEQKGFAKESEGALIIDLGEMTPMLLRKSDGATLYATRDITSLQDRIESHHPDKILYVVANQQALHFEQLFAVAKKLGWDKSELTHVKFGMVLGEDGKKLATREGKVVPLQEVIDKITELAKQTVLQKNPESKNVDEVAHVVAIGALKYNDLKQHPYSDIEFDWKAMLDLSGNSGPYIQYTYARLANILNKAGSFGEGDLKLLVEPTERAMMRQLLDYPYAIQECAERYALNGLALYLYDLAHLSNQFYELVHVLEDEDTSRRDARLLLIKTVARTLKDGLSVLGIQTLERI